MTNTKQKLVDYREGSFVDFEGKDHYFVVCAVLRESVIFENPTRILSFGVSFCNPVGGSTVRSKTRGAKSSDSTSGARELL